MTPEELKRLKELCEKATPGPWYQDGDAETWDENWGYASNWVCTPKENWHGGSNNTADEMCQQMDDAQFIAKARTAMPKLIAECERLASEVERLEEQVARLRGGFMLIHENARLRDALEEIADADSSYGIDDFGRCIRLAREALEGKCSES